MTTATRVRATRAAGTVVIAAVLLTGCASDSSDDAATEDTEASGDLDIAEGRDDEMAAEEADAADGEGASGGGGTDAAADDVVTFGQAVAAGRELARTATITLEVDDVDGAARAVTTAATRVGGFVQTADVQGGEFGSARLTLRVPATQLDPTLLALGEVGLRVVSSGISTDDLTEQLVDLGARIANLETLEAELQELLTSVENSDANASQLLTVYDRINGVRADIERLQAQRTAAADRVALATIHVDLIAAAIAPAPLDPEPQDTLARAWRTTVDAFVVIRDGLIWLVVTILPVMLVVVGLPVLLLWGLLRTGRRRRGAAPVTPPSPATPDSAQERPAAPVAAGSPSEHDE